MSADTVLVTGGAGFVGSNSAWRWPIGTRPGGSSRSTLSAGPDPSWNVPRFEAAGVRFIRADVRFADLMALEHVDAIVERSAEPSVLVGFDDVRSDAGQTNLVGAYNCATFARREDAFLVFLSTSRIYPWS